MKKRLFVLCVLLMSAIVFAGTAAAASDWTLNAGASYQTGSYKFSIIRPEGNEGEGVSYDFSAAAPPLRLSIGVINGPWMLKAYATAWGYGEGEVDPDWWMWDGYIGEEDTEYGLVSDFGADASYLFSVGAIQVGPSIGLRNATVISGLLSPSDGGMFGEGEGIQTLGPRLGAEAMVPVGNRILVNASLGISPFLVVISVGDEHGCDFDGTDHWHSHYRQRIPDLLKTLSFDAGVAASFRVIPAVEITGGCHYTNTQIDNDPEVGWTLLGITTSTTVFYVGAKASF
ncbi:MAG: hypothetical protein BWY85_00703 [Firmicutes bacterium ADurb.Bin506]|nr:MAG: hypothetical protein BWY85_00703 [Firmicutes bacterium ADurb.Bin506]